MQTNLLLTISLRYWQDFQDTLAKISNANIYLFDIQGKQFSNFSMPPEICKKVNNGIKITDKKCLNFYAETLPSIKRWGLLTCPYGIKTWLYALGTYAQKIGFLGIACHDPLEDCNTANSKVLPAKFLNIHRAVNEILKSILEKNILGLHRLELNSLYEISKLLTSTVEVDNILDLIANSVVIIYKSELCLIGLNKGNKIEVVKAKGSASEKLVGIEYDITHPMIEKIFYNIGGLSLTKREFTQLVDDNVLHISDQTKILIYPLWGSLGFIGFICVAVPESLRTIKTLEIYANFAAIALTNATLIRKLEQETITDYLTKLYNKKWLEHSIEKELQKINRHDTSFCVIMMDVDDFKAYNDKFGHPAGDIVLQQIGKIIKTSIRSIDVAARYGGEEFTVILPEADKESAIKVAERIRDRVESFVFPNRKITISIGIACARRDDTLKTLISRVDKALYKAKKEGKNRISII